MAIGQIRSGSSQVTGSHCEYVAVTEGSRKEREREREKERERRMRKEVEGN